jgi:hypothetical protein
VSNLALPGSGSLAAGRVSGYAQLALALVGLGLSIVFGLKFILWYLANYSRLQGPDADPVASFQETLSRMRWAFGGMAVFAVGWLWALGTGMGILRRAHDPPRPDTPPPVQ